ncbi:MAG: ATP-binding protein [Bacteroidota bacterium]
MKRIRIIIISLIVLFISLLAGILTEKSSEVPPKQLIDKQQIENKIEQQIKTARAIFEGLGKLSASDNPDEVFKEVIENRQKMLSQNEMSLYVFQDTNLIYWSDRLMPLRFSSIPEDNRTVLRKKPNGWYLLFSERDNAYTKVAAILLKQTYEYKNEHLPEQVPDIYNVPDDVKIDSIPDKGIPIYHKDKYLFSIVTEEDKVCNQIMYSLSASLYLIAFLSLLFAMYLTYVHFAKKMGYRNWLILAFLADLVLLRFLMMHFDFPRIWMNMDIFSPVHYAETAIYSSLGSMLINVVLLMCFAIVFHRFFRLRSIQVNRFIQFTATIVTYALVFFLIYFGISRIQGIITNSTIPLDFSKLLELNHLSFIAFAVILILMTSLMVITDRLLCESRKFIGAKNWVWAGLFFLPLLVLINWAIASEPLTLTGFISMIVLVGIHAYIRIRKRKYSYYVLLVLSITMAILFTVVINDFMQKKERDQARVLAMNLSNERDAGAEFFIKEINKDICEDEKLINLLEQGEYDKAHEHFYDLYMRGYLEKFDVQLNLCDSKDSLMVSPDDELMHCQDFFDGMSDTYGIALPGTDFYFLDNNNGRISYHGQIPVGVSDSLDPTIYVELESRVQIEGPGYPELLLDKSVMPKKYRDEISYAKYYEKNLITSDGDYDYPEKYQHSHINTLFYSFESDNMWHLAYHPDENNYIVVSYEIKDLKAYFIFFTYIFFVLFMLMNLVYLCNHVIRRRGFGFFGGSLKNRFQTYLLMILSLTIIVIGTVSITFYIRKYRDKQKDAIEEKMQSVLVELNHKLAEEQSLDDDMKGYLNYLLVKFSNVFYTDINLFDPDGKFLASSRMEIYDKGLVGKRMDPDAFERIQQNNAGYFVQNETIGKMKYLSAYLPFKNIHGDILAYINLPYFARQSDFSEEISSLTVALLNVYLIMFIFTILITIVTSNQLTRPLRMIQERLRLMDITKHNLKIRYSGDDEIGSLVQEYNRKVDELAESADKLARSEREFAWREMAKQIAHEIKNPLTPMKLSVQHLEKAYKENDPDFDYMFDRVTKTIIEQIDSLSEIATEFSNFARIRLKEKERVDLVERIYQVEQLFAGLSSTRIVINNEVDGHAWILADKEQVIRMLNNLIKNALQAIPSGEQGIIRISLTEKEKHYLLRIADNGAGIPDDLQDKIFSPSFTTKTSGMGLGLSIVKGIVDNMNGNIYYKTEKGKGSEFFIDIPKMENL